VTCWLNELLGWLAYLCQSRGAVQIYTVDRTVHVNYGCMQERRGHTGITHCILNMMFVFRIFITLDLIKLSTASPQSANSALVGLLFELYRLQWWHFSVVVVRIINTYIKFLQDFVTFCVPKIIEIWLKSEVWTFLWQCILTTGHCLHWLSFPDIPWLACSPFVFFLYLFWMRAFVDKWHKFLWAEYWAL